MSPRSEEFLASAREALRGARAALAADAPARAASSAYYAMLYAARAALSEEDRYAKTHRGAWGLFREAFVVTDRFSEELFRQAQDAQRRREAGDYEAAPASKEEAKAAIDAAQRFLDATVELLGA